MTSPSRMDTAPTERLSPRHRRAAALIALSMLLIASVGAAYLRSTLVPKPPTPASAPTINPLQVTSNAVDYDFVTPSMGWASLFVPGPQPGAGQFQVFRTIDGATHWQQQLAGQSDFRGFSPITVQLFGKTRGFMAVGGPFDLHLYRTADGGAHWDSVILPPSARVDNVAFSDPSSGWLLAAPMSPGTQGLSLYATHDAGNGWQRLADLPVDAAGLSFRRPTEAWLGSFGPGPPHVYTSNDAGQSWQRHDLPAPVGGSWDPTMTFQVLGDLLPGAGVIVSAFGSCAQNGCLAPDRFYFTSSDAGITWRSIPSPPGLLSYQDSVRWWATSANALFKSADAGRSWRQVATIPRSWQFSVPGILDSTHAWASLFVMGGYGLALTNDGGLHWTQAAVPHLA